MSSVLFSIVSYYEREVYEIRHLIYRKTREHSQQVLTSDHILVSELSMKRDKCFLGVVDQKK